MPVPEFIRRIRPDPYILAILAAVALAIALPVHGAILPAFSIATKLAVALLFFLYGARLPTEAVIAGLKHWRLHALTLSITFIAYPLISLAWPFMPAWILAPPLLAGMTYLMCLPSTIQSSVALVASARGDVAAAVCSASLSNIIGVFLAPALVAILMHAQGATVSPQAVRSILIQLLIPFIAGQLAHRWLGAALTRFKTALTAYDRFTIMLIVYGAFSAGRWGVETGRAPPAHRPGHPLRRPLRPDHDPGHRLGPPPRLQNRGRDRRRLLRHAKGHGRRRAHGRPHLPRPPGRPDPPAGPRLPPAPAHRLRGHGLALQSAYELKTPRNNNRVSCHATEGGHR